ncbi:hypothetical protein PWG71_00765 [Nocardiopsis sp. N85]|uniref:protein kinase domain-containing protein n=1 Tax=Nocardiopsis sp. N85 TaxID=3029400 RepID=UPI00237F108A|nr:protein kinase [Nocardiopsis sp. N85]MDE3719903.1 hypothetical protein [Nocardiopsis sp. N85]
MTSNPAPRLTAHTEPLTSDDPREIGGHRIEGRVIDGGGAVLYAARPAEGEPVLVALARAEEADRVLPEPDGAGVCAVGAIETGTLDGRPWAVLPDQPGPHLRGHVAARGALPPWGAVVLAAAVAEALAVLHRQGTAHGEVGPDTVVLTDGGPRLLDTGLGRRAAAPVTPGLRGVSGWVAPEVYGGGRPTPAADVFGWACLVVLAATAREPFGESPASRLGERAALVEMERRARQDTVDLAGVPQSLREVVAGALSPDPDDRPSAEETLAAALRHLDGGDAEPTADRLRAALSGTRAPASVPPGPVAPAIPVVPTPGDASSTEDTTVPSAFGTTGAPGAAGGAVTAGTPPTEDTTVPSAFGVSGASAPETSAETGVASSGAATPPGAADTMDTATVPARPGTTGPKGPPGADSAAPTGFGIYTDPVTLEGSAVAGAAPAALAPGTPVAPGGLGTPPLPGARAGGAPTGFGVHPVPGVPAAGRPVTSWNAPGEAAGTIATLVRGAAKHGRTSLLVNVAVVSALVLGVLVVMLFRVGVL